MNNLKIADELTAKDEQPIDVSDGILLECLTKTYWWNWIPTKLVEFNFHRRVTLTYNFNPRTQSINRLE